MDIYLYFRKALTTSARAQRVTDGRGISQEKGVEERKTWGGKRFVFSHAASAHRSRRSLCVRAYEGCFCVGDPACKNRMWVGRRRIVRLTFRRPAVLRRGALNLRRPGSSQVLRGGHCEAGQCVAGLAVEGWELCGGKWLASYVVLCV